MTPDPNADDLAIRAAMRELAPHPAPNFDSIDMRAAKHIRRGHIRLGVSIGLMAAVTAIVVPLAGNHSDGRVHVSSGAHRRVPIFSSTTARPQTTTSFRLSPSTGTLPIGHDPQVSLPIVVPTTVPVVAPTIAPVVTPPAVTPTTVKPKKDPYPPVIDGYARLVVVLDDTGLHAQPTVTVPTSHFADILFLDRRSNRPDPNDPTYKGIANAYLVSVNYPYQDLELQNWNGEACFACLPTLFLAPGEIVLQAQDDTTNNIPGATVTITVVAN